MFLLKSIVLSSVALLLSALPFVVNKSSCLPQIRIELASPKSEAKQIKWERHRPLSWSDFQDVAPRDELLNIAAVTSSMIRYRYYCEEGLLVFRCEAVFLQNESWVRDDSRTAHYLDHEQKHFDITELFNRIMDEKISRKTYRCSQEQLLVGDLTRIIDDWRSVQSRYDDMTGYSLNLSAQHAWEISIAHLLREEDAADINFP